MLNKIIGVTLDGIPGADISWTKTEFGYRAAHGVAVGPIPPPDASMRTTEQIDITTEDLPPAALRDDHSLFTFVTGEGIHPGWINAYRLSLPWRDQMASALRLAGYRQHANLIVPFADSLPTLVLFGRGESAFTTAEIDDVYDHLTYNSTIRKTLRSDLRLTAAEQNGIAQLEVQLLEAGGADSTRTGVTVYWESTGGYFVNTRTQTVNGKATAVLKDYKKPCVVKAGFRHFPSKTQITL